MRARNNDTQARGKRLIEIQCNATPLSALEVDFDDNSECVQILMLEGGFESSSMGRSSEKQVPADLKDSKKCRDFFNSVP